jgi:hypothetical protein
VGRTNVPAQFTSFVGRDDDLAAVTALLGRHRLVTLVGPGGAGKTRLAAETAVRVLDQFPGGTWLAELARSARPPRSRRPCSVRSGSPTRCAGTSPARPTR